MNSDREDARRSFEAILEAKGRSDLTRKGAGYKNANTQTKWRYFALGWSLSRKTNAH